MLKSLKQYVYNTSAANTFGMDDPERVRLLVSRVRETPVDDIPTILLPSSTPWRCAMWIRCLLPRDAGQRGIWTPERISYLGLQFHMRGIFPSGAVLYSAITGCSVERAELFFLFLALASGAAMDAGQTCALSFNRRLSGKGEWLTFYPTRHDFPVWLNALSYMGRLSAPEDKSDRALSHNEAWVEPTENGFILASRCIQTDEVKVYGVRLSPKDQWKSAPKDRLRLKSYMAYGPPRGYPEVEALLRHIAMASEGAAEFPFEIKGTPAQWADLVARLTQDTP